MELIHNWLNGAKHFAVGRAIYKALGSDAALNDMFSLGYSDYNQLTLERELRAIVEPHNTRQLPCERDETLEMKPPAPEIKDPMLEAIYEEWKPQYMKMNYLRHELDQFEGTSEVLANIRRPIATEILMIEKKLTKQWADSDYYKEFGHLPNLPEREFPIPENPVELANLISNCKRNIRRNRQKMEQGEAPTEYMPLVQYWRDYYFKLTGNEYTEKKD
jgi:hypothetical protein